MCVSTGERIETGMDPFHLGHAAGAAIARNATGRRPCVCVCVCCVRVCVCVCV